MIDFRLAVEDGALVFGPMCDAFQPALLDNVLSFAEHVFGSSP